MSYFGYALMVLGMILTFFNRESRFRRLVRELKQMQDSVLKTVVAGVLFSCLVAGGSASAYALPRRKRGWPTVPKEQAVSLGS